MDVDSLQHREDKIKLNHIRRYNLLNTLDRTDFIKEFIALVRCLAAGDINIGFLGKNNPEIHRMMKDAGDVSDELVLCPPQQELTGKEESLWREDSMEEFTN